jgi:hypothetical protein
MRLAARADGVDRNGHDGGPDDRRADGHDGEEMGDLLSVATGCVECGLGIHGFMA